MEMPSVRVWRNISGRVSTPLPLISIRMGPLKKSRLKKSQRDKFCLSMSFSNTWFKADKFGQHSQLA